MRGQNEGHADGEGRVYQSSGDQYITENNYSNASWVGPDSVRHPPIGRVPLILRDRNDLMSRLKSAVAKDRANDVFVLHGLGGSGKTAVASAVFKHATTESGRLGLWVNASDQTSLRAGMLAVAADRGAHEGELMAARNGLRAAADLVWDRLDQSAQPWLLVLDNADDPAILRDGAWLRTSPRGTVLVTTRQAATYWWPAAQLLHVGVLPRDEAAQVLCDLAPQAGTAEEAAAVADRLGRLPLALTLAGGFLAHQVIEPWSMAEYDRHLSSRRDLIELLDQGAGADSSDSRHLASSTWQISLENLVNQGLPEAVTLLQLLSCWSSESLPLPLLSGVEVGQELPKDRVELALRGLLDHSLTELVTIGQRCVRTHGVLLHSVARSVPVDRQDLLALSASKLLIAKIPELPERGKPEPQAGLLAPHALALIRRVSAWHDVRQTAAEAAFEAAFRLIITQHRGGDYASALSLAREATELGEARLGEDHILVLRIRQRVGKSVDRLGRLEEAADLHRQVLADLERVCGVDSPDTLTSCLHLSRPLTWLGHTAEAVGLMHRTVSGRVAHLGRWHPLTLEAMACLLELPPGPELESEAGAGPALVSDCLRELGAHHPITLSAELNCAHALFNTGQPDEALPRARRAVAQHESRYGAEYPITLAARSLLGSALSAVGQNDEAIEQTGLVVNGRERILGPTHPWTVIAKQKLANYRQIAGQE
ncbi:tetratricopeptide repeat protein [Streptomyces sp. NPDC001513]|uniref:tetratricopeptide repeat protein n=1 Tax=Streptomyces sp. NPDC001513 TaxID=3364580 RepID=UPI0036AC865F